MSADGCPIPETHGRIRQAHQAWHQALDSYDDPASFVSNLNSYLEKLHSIQYLLRNELGIAKKVEDPWLEKWRTRFARDPIMMWLIDARNIVVHERDLKMRSRASVRILADWNDTPFHEFDVPNDTPSEEIAARAAAMPLPDWVQSTGMVIVERRWIVESLPNHEILDAAAHGFGMMARFVDDAHRRLGHDREVEAGERVDGRPACMATTEDIRTVAFTLMDEEQIEVGASAMTPATSPEQHARIEKRFNRKYRPDLDLDSKKRDTSDLMEVGRTFLELAKNNLANDLGLIPVVVTREPSTGLKIHMLPVNSTKAVNQYLMWRIARSIERSRADGIIKIADAWIAPMDDSGFAPSEHPEQSEALTLTVAEPNGDMRSVTVPYSRGFKGITFHAESYEDGISWYGPLEPIREAWRKIYPPHYLGHPAERVPPPPPKY